MFREATASMRPPCVYANPARPGGPEEILALLRGRYRVAARLVMVLLSLRRWQAAEIAGLLCCDPVTVRRWIGRYNSEGTAGLADRPRPGRPRLGGPRLGGRIRALLAVPRAWTIPRLWRYLGRPPVSLRTVHRRVREQARWRRPRLVAPGDPDAAGVIAAIRAALAALPAGAVVLAEDETHLMLLPWVRATWVLRGTRQQVMTPGKNRRRAIFGALDVAAGTWHYAITRTADSAAFTAFCCHLLAAYPAAPVITVICDNGIIHRSKATRAWLGAHPRLRLLHGARYSPHHNPAERVWAALKAYLADTPTATMAGRIRQARAFFGARSPAQMLATAAPGASPWFPDSYRQNFWKAA
jgi:transposase